MRGVPGLAKALAEDKKNKEALEAQEAAKPKKKATKKKKVK